MNAPTLLTIGQRETIPDTTFDDLQLRRLLPEKTIRILSRPIGAEEIEARQKLFMRMRSEDGYARIKECYAALKEYERAVRVWRATSSTLEKRYLFYQALVGFSDICGRLRALEEFGAGTRLEAIAVYWRDTLAALNHLEDDLSAMRDRLMAAGRGCLSIAERCYLTKDAVPVTLYDELASAAADLGLTVPEPKGMRIRLNDAIANAFSELYPEETAQFEALAEPYQTLPFDEPIAYIEELDFFFSILNLCSQADACGIPVCYPQIAKQRCYLADQVYDISLFIKKTQHIIPNDMYFSEKEPFFFITGANGGGKTTYLRASGINLILFLGGCPIFAQSAEIYPFHSVLSHFPADERFVSSGRLQEEKQRVDRLLADCDADTFIVFNETYSGTDDKMGCQMTLDTAAVIREKNTSGLFVTHFHEVRTGGWPMLNTVIEEDENHGRTFRIVRDFGITSSYANDILRKYKLDEASLKERGVGT